MSFFFNLALNLGLAVMWIFVTESFSLLNFAIGLVVGYIGIGLTSPGYAARVARGIFFVFYVAYKIIESAVIVTILALHPTRRPDPGIIAVPLDIESHGELILLATIITLTPGTISVETGMRRDGKRVLFVHCLTVGDPDDVRHSIKNDFERRIIEIMEPVEAWL